MNEAYASGSKKSCVIAKFAPAACLTRSRSISCSGVVPTSGLPEVKVATAIVNGFVITGTDIDQRVALVTAASDAEVPPDEMLRLRVQVLRNLIDETLKIQAAEAADMRHSQVRSLDRSERIRTYNFPENRIVDHRTNYKAYNLDAVLDGDLQAVIDSDIQADEADRLANQK